MSWKEAASLILMALKEKPYTSLYNYKILMLKRSAKSSFMPNGNVFPGGTVEEIDSSVRWTALFQKFNVTEPEKPEKLPPMFQKNNAGLPKELSLKITAIRETFEETGVLLCRREAGDPQWATSISENVSQWREKVQADPKNFLEMCESLDCVPDISSLKLWSNWLTPPDFDKRFDTVFYTACLPKEITSSADLGEIQKLEWCSPDRLYRSSLEGRVWLPPPQFYELSRVMQFHMLEDLATFADEREKKGCDRFDAIRIKTKEGMIFAGPGDDLYQKPDSGELKGMTFEEARGNSEKLHRLEIGKNGSCDIFVSGLDNIYGHVFPVSSLNKRKTCCRM